jgi:diguanylate cyclase (GGDEF)-like protein
MSDVSSGLVDSIHSLSSRSGHLEKALMSLLSEVMSCCNYSEVLEKVDGGLDNTSHTRISVWKAQSNDINDVQTTTLQQVNNKPFVNIPYSDNSTWNQATYKTSIVQPLFDQDDILAIVKFERPFSFDISDVKVISYFIQTVNTHLHNLTKQTTSTLVEQLSVKLFSAQDYASIANPAFEILLKELGLKFGALLIQQGGHFYPLSSYGSWDEAFSSTGLPVNTSWLEPSYRRGEITYSESNLAVHDTKKLLGKLSSYVVYPLGNTSPTRFILVLGDEAPSRWLNHKKIILASIGHVLKIALHSIESQIRLKTLLSLQHHSLADSEATLLHHILLAAIQTVPGAEAGSLLIKQGRRFHFHAAIGYDFDAIKSFSFKSADMLYWQHPELLHWNSSDPRIFSKKDTTQKHILEGAALSPAFREVGRVDEIQSNLYFPIVHQGQVLAVLNLDNFQDLDAFAEDSLEVARMFGPPVASLLRERRYRYLLERDSLTDPLTNLANRRAFDQTLIRETAHSERFHFPFSLLMLDLGGFKCINDRLGHPQGDAVLVEVAKTLKKVTRTNDQLFRWGGDEFAVVLPNTNYEGAVTAARRCARAIKRIKKKDLSIDVHIGIASFPSCATNATTLLRLADERLYKAKEQDITVFLSQSFLERQKHDP